MTGDLNDVEKVVREDEDIKASQSAFTGYESVEMSKQGYSIRECSSVPTNETPLSPMVGANLANVTNADPTSVSIAVGDNWFRACSEGFREIRLYQCGSMVCALGCVGGRT
jgi:hypothetical protein